MRTRTRLWPIGSTSCKHTLKVRCMSRDPESALVVYIDAFYRWVIAWYHREMPAGRTRVNILGCVQNHGNFVHFTLFQFPQLYEWLTGSRQWWIFAHECSSRISCSVAGCFPEWCSIEQACHGVKCKALLGDNTALYMSLRLLFKRQTFVILPVVVAHLNALSTSACFWLQV